MVTEHTVRREDAGEHMSPVRLYSFLERFPGLIMRHRPRDARHSHMKLLLNERRLSSVQTDPCLHPHSLPTASLQLEDSAFGTVEDGELSAQLINTFILVRNHLLTFSSKR